MIVFHTDVLLGLFVKAKEQRITVALLIDAFFD